LVVIDLGTCVGAGGTWAFKLLVMVVEGDPGHGLIGVTDTMVGIECTFVSNNSMIGSDGEVGRKQGGAL